MEPSKPQPLVERFIGKAPRIEKAATAGSDSEVRILVDPDVTAGSFDDVQRYVEKTRRKAGVPRLLSPPACDEVPIAASRMEAEHIVPTSNGWITAVRLAYSHHLCLSFRPDDLWACILFSIAKHVEYNAEKYRSDFVQFEGKTTLRVHLPWAPDEKVDWDGVVHTLCEMADENTVASVKDAFVPSFSTTDEVSVTSCKIAMMAALAPYFDYEMRTLCGIREVRMQGTLEDWMGLRSKVAGLALLGALGTDLAGWFSLLDKTIQELIDTHNGHPSADFWRSIYSLRHPRGSGDVTRFGGWFLYFFLYDVRGNRIEHSESPSLPEGSLPCGYCSVPVKWTIETLERELVFFSGSWATEVNDAAGYVAPVMHWLIAEAAAGKRATRRG